MSNPVLAHYQFRNDSAADWTSVNPTLLLGEIGLESDTHQLKMGDGVTPWVTLSYLSAGPQGVPGPQGVSAQTFGSTTLDFGSLPGKADASVVVIGQAGILATSNVQAFVMGDTTTDHSSDEHLMVGIKAIAGSVVPGVGFTIRATAAFQVTGQFTIRWMWQ